MAEVMNLCELMPGDSFRLKGEGVEGTVVKVGASSVLVRLSQAKSYEFVTGDGREVSFVKYQRTEWSRGTRVERRTE